jgi:hypothetical protein
MSKVEEVEEKDISSSEKIRNTIRERWLKQLMEENPESNPYMMDCMIDLYLLDSKKTEEIIMKHIN